MNTEKAIENLNLRMLAQHEMLCCVKNMCGALKTRMDAHVQREITMMDMLKNMTLLLGQIARRQGIDMSSMEEMLKMLEGIPDYEPPPSKTGIRFPSTNDELN